MKTMQDATKKKFNTIFSHTLLKQYEYYCLKSLGSIGPTTSNGHGPFVELSSGSVVYDLRGNNERWIFGNSHPLAIKAQVNHQLRYEINANSSLPPQQDIIQEIINDCSHRVQASHSWQFSNCFLSPITFAPKGFKLINTSHLEEIRMASQENKDELCPLVHLTYEGCLFYWEEIQRLFENLDQNAMSFGIVEEDTLGFCNKDFVFTEFTQNRPSFLSSNFNLETFICWSDASSQHDSYKSNYSKKDITRYQLELLDSFTRFLYEGHFFGDSGRIQRISNAITMEVTNFLDEQLQQRCLHLTWKNPKMSWEQLLSKGILASNSNQLCFSFPISIKTEHLTEIFQILARDSK